MSVFEYFMIPMQRMKTVCIKETSASPSWGGVASVPISPSEKGVASVPVNFPKGWIVYSYKVDTFSQLKVKKKKIFFVRVLHFGWLMAERKRERDRDALLWNKKKNIITWKYGSKLVYLLTLIGIQLKHAERLVACYIAINHLSKHCQDEPQGYGTAHGAWHIWKSRADLLLPLAHSSADNGQEIWLLLTAGQRPMGYPVSCQDPISSRVPLGGFRSTPFYQVTVRTHNQRSTSTLYSCCMNTLAQTVGASTGKLTLIGWNQSHQWSPVHSSGIFLVCAQSHAITCCPGQSWGLGRCGVFIQKAKPFGSLPPYLNRNTGLAMGKAI